VGEKRGTMSGPSSCDGVACADHELYCLV